MSKKLLSFFFAVIALLTATNANATVGDIFTTEVSGVTMKFKVTAESPNKVIVYAKNYESPSISKSTTGAVVVPSSVTYNEAEYTVVALGSNAFRSCTGITSITIPATVTKINEAAFTGCTGLTEVNISDLSVWCSLSFATKTNPLLYAGTLKLNGTTVTDMTVPATTIGTRAFQGCTSITSVDFSSCTTIGAYSFEGCSNLSSVTIPSTVTSIKENAFKSCSGMTEVNIDNLTTWANRSFNPEYTNPLSNGAALVLNGTTVTDLTIPDAVTTIGTRAFVSCSSITSVNFGNGCTKIGDYAFKGCSNLNAVTIPSNVTTFGENSFQNCPNIATVNITDLAKWCQTNFSTDYTNPLSNGAALYVNGSLVENLTIPNVTSIYTRVFKGCSSIKTLNLGTSCTTVGTQAFKNCTALTSVTVNANTTTFNEDAFSGCTALTEVNINDLATWCGASFATDEANPLFNAHSIKISGTATTDLEIPSGVSSIASRAFIGCQLNSLDLGSCTTVGAYAFKKSAITTITIPATVTNIADYAFISSTAETINCEGAPASVNSYLFGPADDTNSIMNSATFNIPIEYLASYTTADIWRANLNNLSIITDGDSYTNTNGATYMYNANIKYKRIFKNTNWQALFVPFNIKYDAISANFEVAKITSKTTNSDNVKIAEITGGTLNAGTPYLIKAKTASTDYQTIEVSPTVLKTASDKTTLEYGTCTFTGVYETFADMYAVGGYAMSGGKICPALSTAARLSSFRWYMTDSSSSNVKKNGIALDFEEAVYEYDEFEETAIEDIKSDTNTNNVWYNLQGQRVEKPTTRGIYIKNGKKILF